ncbi:SH3 domain-containing protein, partial [bacterium AH-315-P15]|nr:SH3 domain-containing protein [bacterium AH-315-P15]
LRAPIGLYTDYALEPAQGDYVITTNTNVRLGASTSSPIVTTLAEGTVVEAAGQVRGGEWMLMARNGAVIGYMYAELLVQREGGDVLLAGGAARRPTYCRSYEQRLSLRGGARDHWQGAACRSPRGQWEIEGRRGAGV